ncbi:hypothetical protein [Anoxybacillus gonensis]|uniref:hypothetical protein n=1 Tax=Anoxybacillus gonensis TaxID=198467 RepID=UPI0002BFA4F4|nr:hypothetical protein [Anoxybacillus gonensis]EMI11237.1 hypothetical protein F510_0650 [Anoxybacillus gonensis]
MIQLLLKEVEGIGCAVEVEGDKLKLLDPRPLTTDMKNQLREHKTEILELFKREELAKKRGWIAFPYGGGYEKQISRNTSVFIFLEDDGTYTVWRATWFEGAAPAKESTIVERVDFETAFERANNYVQWFQKKG